MNDSADQLPTGSGADPSIGWHRIDPSRVRLFAVALLVGVLVACTTALLIAAISAVQALLFGSGDERYFATLLSVAPWLHEHKRAG